MVERVALITVFALFCLILTALPSRRYLAVHHLHKLDGFISMSMCEIGDLLCEAKFTHVPAQKPRTLGAGTLRLLGRVNLKGAEDEAEYEARRRVHVEQKSHVLIMQGGIKFWFTDTQAPGE